MNKIVKEKTILLVERLYHHDTLQMVSEYFEKAWIRCQIIVGESVSKHLSEVRGEVTILPQPKRKKRLKSSSFSKLSWVRRVWKIYLWLKARWEMQKNIWQTFLFYRKWQFNYIYFNTTNNVFCWPMWLVFLRVSKKKKIAMLHNTNMGINNNPMKIITNAFLQIFYRKIVWFFILWEYLKLPKFIKKTTIIFTLNRSIKIKKIKKEIKKWQAFIPWRIWTGRRDEEEILTLIEKLKGMGFLTHIMTKQEPRNIKKKLTDRGLMEYVTIHKWFIKEEKYKNLLETSEVVIININKKNKDYWTYQISWTIGDALAYANFILLPDRYAEKYNFWDGVVRYNQHNIGEKIIQRELKINVKELYKEGYIVKKIKNHF